MNTTWIVIGLGVAIAIVARVTNWHRGNQAADLGSVSHQWIAEHRQDSRR